MHKSAKAAAIVKERGAWFLFLPQYSPDLNPIEMAFSKLKEHLRAAAERTFEDLWRSIGDILRSVRARRMLELFQSRRLCIRLNARSSRAFSLKCDSFEVSFSSSL